MNKQYLGVVALSAAMMLSACGGGGNSGVSAGTSTTGTTVTLAAPSSQTLAGGQPLTITATVSDSSAVTWALGANQPGTLSATTGASITYTPPATVSANTPVTITATANSVVRSIGLTVFADPGAPGMTLVSGALDSPTYDAPVDGPAASARFRQSRAVAGDINGNLLVAGTCMTSPGQYAGFTLRKISNTGTVSTLASCETNTWFGAADTSANLTLLSQPYGLATDYAGNVYTGSYNGDIAAGATSPSARAVFRITQYGLLTVTTGATGSHTASVTDGTAVNARYLTPTVAGFDTSDYSLYILDQDGSKVRKLDPSGNVTTVAAVPAAVIADLNGNTYRIDSSQTQIIRTTPAGVDSVVADIHTLPGASAAASPRAYSLSRTGPASYTFLVSNGSASSNEAVVKLVVAH